MIKTLCISILCFAIWNGNIFAQLKYEREYRLKKEQVPTPAIEFLDACNFSSKIKWYGEESLIGHSVEAKLKEEKVKYSIEFDTLGTLEDVEIDIPWDQVEKTAQQNIAAYLNQVFERHKLIKIQLQWTGKRETVLELVKTGSTTKPYTSKYEIVLKGKADRKTVWYEFLFSDKGKFEKKSTIIFRNTDNLDY